MRKPTLHMYPHVTRFKETASNSFWNNAVLGDKREKVKLIYTILMERPDISNPRICFEKIKHFLVADIKMNF